MAVWLRRWTWNPMGSSRAGSNPARSETFSNTATRYLKQKRRNGKKIIYVCKQNRPTNKNKRTQKDNLERSYESTFGLEVGLDVVEEI